MNKNISARLAGHRPVIVDESAYFVSAVLLPLIHKNGEECILFEVRSQNLNRQPGEICFPGGKLENGEQADPLSTAVRETTEELGVSRRDIEILGPLDILVTPLSTMVYPFAGRISSCASIRPNLQEVDQIFFVPVNFFLSTPPYVTHVEVSTRYNRDFPLEKVPPSYKEGWQARSSFPMYFYEYDKYFIWGLTGKILFNFLRICWPDHHIFQSPPQKWR